MRDENKKKQVQLLRKTGPKNTVSFNRNKINRERETEKERPHALENHFNKYFVDYILINFFLLLC